MNWIEPYRNHILKYSYDLGKNSFSFLGENDYSLKYTDGDILLMFSVDRYSDSLSVWVEYLNDDPVDDEKYRLDMVMSIYQKKDMTDVFKVSDEGDKERIVKNYIDFIINHKVTLLGKVFPLAKEYRDHNQKEGLTVLARFAKGK